MPYYLCSFGTRIFNILRFIQNDRGVGQGTAAHEGERRDLDLVALQRALDDDTKADIEDMICEHSLMYSRGSLGFLDYTEEEKQMFKPVLQRLVRTHPGHGRKSLYLSSHAGAIKGMSMPE